MKLNVLDFVRIIGPDQFPGSGGQRGSTSSDNYNYVLYLKIHPQIRISWVRSCMRLIPLLLHGLP